jgi:kynurenine formamidase
MSTPPFPSRLLPLRIRALRALCLPATLSLLGAAIACDTSARQPAATIDLARFALVDLTHAYNAQTIFWPTDTNRFALRELSRGTTPGGWFYSSNAFTSPEHGGTHLDAPIHFQIEGRTSESIPLEQLVALAVVIDVTAQANANADYLLMPDDVLAFEREHGTITPGTIVLLRTGWSERWPDRLRYLGDDTPGDASQLHFPSFGADAARLLVDERRVAALGVDVASIDGGQSADFMVHRIAALADVPGFENLTNLSALPARGALVVALPMKIEGGSGGPLRAIAFVPR